jgi:hypothetical protein
MRDVRKQVRRTRLGKASGERGQHEAGQANHDLEGKDVAGQYKIRD